MATLAARVPDELLKDMLSLVLNVHDDRFSDTSNNSPFAHVPFSTSSILLVCKRWLRIATPQLYSTVILRTTAQTLSLCNALAANPHFVQRVRRLRLEGTVENALVKHVTRMTELEHVAIALNQENTRKMSVLFRFLRALDPLSIAFARLSSGMMISDLIKQLEQIMPQWRRLRTIILPQYGLNFYESVIATPLIDIALKLPTVQQVTVPLQRAADLAHRPYGICTFTQRKAMPSNHVRLVVTAPDAHMLDPRTLDTEDFPMLRRSVFFRTADGREECVAELLAAQDAQTSTLWHNPLDSASAEVRRAILQQIAREAIRKQDSASPPPRLEAVWFEWSRQVDLRVAATLLLTNREFSEIVSCVLAERLNPHCDSQVLDFLQVALARPRVFSSIRSITLRGCNIPICARIIDSATDLLELALAWPLGEDGLRQIFEALEQSGAKPKLKKLEVLFTVYVQPSKERSMPTFLAGFTSLTTLNWYSSNIMLSPCVSEDLPALVEVSTSIDCDSLVCCLAAWRLPKLRKLSLRGKTAFSSRLRARDAEMSNLSAFLEQHGYKLLDLVLETYFPLTKHQLNLCPAVETISFDSSCAPIQLFDSTVSSVKRINVAWYNFSGPPSTAWQMLLDGLYSGGFPGLQELVATNEHQNFWPSSGDYNGSRPWQTEASEKLKDRGVIMRDSKGHTHRPRLDVSNVLRRSGRARK